MLDRGSYPILRSIPQLEDLWKLWALELIHELGPDRTNACLGGPEFMRFSQNLQCRVCTIYIYIKRPACTCICICKCISKSIYLYVYIYIYICSHPDLERVA